MLINEYNLPMQDFNVAVVKYSKIQLLQSNNPQIVYQKFKKEIFLSENTVHNYLYVK